MNLRICLNLFLKFRYLFKGLRKAYISPSDWGRYELRNTVDLGVGNIKGPAYVLDGGTRGEGPKGDDLANGIPPVQVDNVIDNLSTSPNAEVDINVGERLATGVEESFKDEVVLQGVD